MDIEALATLWLIYLAVALSPGVNFALIAQTATHAGRLPALWVSAGVTAATTVWMTASLLGLAALAESAGNLFAIIRIAAGLYLMWLGLTKLFAHKRPAPAVPHGDAHASAARNFSRGFITNMGNPKAILFFGSLFASALPPDSGAGLRLAGAILVLVSSVLIHAGLASALSAEKVRVAYRRARRRIDTVFGVVLIAFGVRLIRTP